MSINESIISKTSKYFKGRGINLPKISELVDPHTINPEIINKLKSIDKNEANPLNLFRVNWFNNRDHSSFLKAPEHIVLPSEFTGVDAKIIVNLGRYFPLITAHKVLAAYGCLLPRILNGTFDYEIHKAVWPSTGNYCRGGVAISKILGLKSVAILPEGMSQERFNWLEKWVENTNDIIKTTGTESNVKEIYDACRTIIKHEDAFIDLAFQMGPLEGLQANEVKQYIRFIGNRRLEQLGLKPIYDVKKNPLTWLDTMLNGVEHMNFFEGRATEYSKASTKGTWSEAFS